MSYSASTVADAAKRRGRNLGSMLKSLTPTQAIVGGALVAAGVVLATRNRRAAGKLAARPEAAPLDELLHFVNDRIAGYERAVAESQDADLRGYYKQLVSQSQQFATDLNTYLTRAGGERQTAETLKGKLYRQFMKAQAALTGHSETSLLAFNVHGEQWALAAYEEALADPRLSPELRPVIERQRHLSEQTLERLKKLTETHAKA